MHFVSDVLLASGDQMVNIGHSVDISRSGCKLKVFKEQDVANGQTLELRFKKFEEDFEFGLTKGLDYQVVSIDDESEEFNILGLKRLSCDKTTHFDEFLSNYITGNKRRYRVDVNNAVESVLSRGYGQYSMPRRTDMALFLRENGFDLEPYVAVVTELNQKVVEYWQDKHKHLLVHHALTPRRLKIIQHKLAANQNDSYLYTFSGVNQAGEKIIYAALREELEGDVALRNTFWSFGCKKYDFRVFCITMTESDAKYAHQPLSLDSESIKAFKQLNKKPSPQVMRKLQGLSHILTFKDITSTFNRPEYVTATADQSCLSKVKQFKVVKAYTHDPLMIPIKFIDARRENRFDIKTSVLVSSDKTFLKGASLDLSTKGLKVRFEKPVNLFKGNQVKVTFPDFEDNEHKLDMTKLDYQVVEINDAKDECCLSVAGDVRSHRGRLYFRDLIRKNKNHLVDYQTGNQDSELGHVCTKHTGVFLFAYNGVSDQKRPLFLNHQGFAGNNELPVTEPPSAR